MVDCIFCKIIRKEIPSQAVYENDSIYAFRDINPKAPVHIMIVPKKHFPTLNQTEDFSIYPDIFRAVTEIAKQEGIDEKGYRVVANCNDDGGQTVYHIHFHLLGGRFMHWPPG